MEAMDKKEAMKSAYREDNGKAKGRSTNNEFHPWHPPYEPRPSKPADLDFDSYLELVSEEDGRGVRWGLTITAETFDHMIVTNALRCAKVALEGQADELKGHHTNPNYMNQYGYFPLHEAAERFSVDMIKLLLKHGVKTNLHMAGNEVVEDLLPLHVAVEKTCIHKYLEDNLFYPGMHG